MTRIVHRQLSSSLVMKIICCCLSYPVHTDCLKMQSSWKKLTYLHNILVFFLRSSYLSRYLFPFLPLDVSPSCALHDSHLSYFLFCYSSAQTNVSLCTPWMCPYAHHKCVSMHTMNVSLRRPWMCPYVHQRFSSDDCNFDTRRWMVNISFQPLLPPENTPVPIE